MKKQKEFFICLLVAIVSLAKIVIAQESEIQFIYEDSYYAVTTTSLILRDSGGNELSIIPEGDIVEVLGYLPLDTEKAIVCWDGINGTVLDSYLAKDFIRISIQNQTLTMYKQGIFICETPVVTGMDETDRETPTGIFSIQDMCREQILKGEGYESYVEYWMPFYYGYGIHDADGWRWSYGGDIYKYAGSHGCVNTPLENVKIIYENAYIGMLVIIK